MSKILGLDLGTNSIGWAIVEYEKKQENSFQLKGKGVHVFQEGVKIENGVESSKAAERTKYRSARRLKFRRKLRKIQTLSVLSEFGLVPELSKYELDQWRYKKIYPLNQEFRNWQLTDDSREENPYYYRHLAVTQKLDLNKKENRYVLGRAFYHICQRRGFHSNRLETTKESDGKVIQGIDSLSEAKGDRTLGQYFYECYKNREKIRTRYTHRELHYEDEFNKICDFQGLDNISRDKLYRAIFYQRKPKSQKGNIGKCPFEPTKPRCSTSHPLFEEFRMHSFINNIRIKTENDVTLRPLIQEEKESIIPLFFRKSKPYFDFEEICKKLTPKGKNYGYVKGKNQTSEFYLFNYQLHTTVSGCPTYAQLMDIFGEPVENFIHQYVNLRKNDGKEKRYEEILDDIWHVLYTFDDLGKLAQFARIKLGLDDKKAVAFSKISLKREFSTLSLKAIRKILPWLKKGLIYSHAVFLAKLDDILPDKVWDNPQMRKTIENDIRKLIDTQGIEVQLNEIANGLIKDCQSDNVSWSENDQWQNLIKADILKKLKQYYGTNSFNNFDDERKKHLEKEIFLRFRKYMHRNAGRGEFIKSMRLEERVKDFLHENYSVDKSKLSKLYHPSSIETYKKSGRSEDGIFYLGSPMVSSIRNPMAMRCLHRLRRLLNEMLSEGLIDNDTIINIELARDLNDANFRKAIQQWQKDNETRNKEYRERIIELYSAETGIEIEPTNDEILKYQLWEEQNHICLYTGDQIGVSQFIGANPLYDLEHTIPRSLSFDNSQMNLTLCNNKFNRDIKRNRIPGELSNQDEILSRISHWKDRVEEINNEIEKKRRASRSTVEKDKKDRIIQKRHRLIFERDYWLEKYRRFEMKDVPEGFKNSQLNDTRIITRYACMYLKTCFERVYPVKATIVADFRKMWGLQAEFTKKERVSHIHHVIDAITIACMTKRNYDELAHHYSTIIEKNGKHERGKLIIPKPWETFTEDLGKIENEILVTHYTPDNLLKSQKKKLRERGRIVRNDMGESMYQRGDSARGSLHLEKYYGAINVKEGDEKDIQYVIRKKIEDLKQGDLKYIVDKAVRDRIEQAFSEKGIKTALSETIWMNKDKGIPIKKVRCFTPNVKNPILLKKHRDVSQKEYKRFINVVNDENYLMALYEGFDNKGVERKDFEILSNLDACKNFKKNQKDMKNDILIPEKHPVSGLPLKQILKIGSMVLLLSKNSDEVKKLDINGIAKRLYKITGLSSMLINGKYRYGVITLKHHNEARPSKELKIKSGVFKADEKYKPFRKLLHTQFNAMIEGNDFILSISGRISFKNRIYA